MVGSRWESLVAQIANWEADMYAELAPSVAGTAPSRAGNVQMKVMVKPGQNDAPFISKPGSMSAAERMRSRFQAFQPSEEFMDANDFSYDEFARNIDVPTFSRGDLIKGVVIAFEPNGALIDIGAKASAYVSTEEMAIEKVQKPEMALDLGGTYEFAVTSAENENGQRNLSRRRVLYEEAWTKVQELSAKDESLMAPVVSVNRGGALLTVEGLRAFLPGSHMLPGQVATEEMVGEVLKVKFLDVSKEDRKIVVSHKMAVFEDNNFSVGSVLLGAVTKLQPYGAFVNVGMASGLLHISQISNDRISSVESVLQEGQKVKVMILQSDDKKGRVSLSTKVLEEEPGDMIHNQQKVFDNAESVALKYQKKLEEDRQRLENLRQSVALDLDESSWLSDLDRVATAEATGGASEAPAATAAEPEAEAAAEPEAAADA
jgi:small subunit ribosomal protein S1